ncbi:MAG: hypothetical protein RL701_6400 [Pseudomonadota bacterium]
MLLKLLYAALALLIVMFIALLWLVARLAHITMLLPACVTAFIVLAALCILLYRRIKASGAANGLEQALQVQAREQAKLVRPDLQAEVEHMQSEFDKAVGALKSAKLGPGGRNALYFLPWYAIIGPPGAGKSTALRSSGLNFPYTSGSGGAAVKGLGGTRNCDWWLTNEAVLLDTAGRWATQDEDRDEWISFLDLLKRYRPRKPLNGIIAAISVGDVVNAREEEVVALAERMRARLDEVQTQLRVSIPVYVLFTKSDLVEGFLETFGDMKRSDRDQVWGFTVPLSDRGAVGEMFRTRFEELATVLEKRSLTRIAEERSIDRRTSIYSFPQQFVALRRNLERFVEVMFQFNVYSSTPALRGVYFTSGTQEGRPFNLLMDRLAEALGIRRKDTAAEVIDQKSYFLHDVFSNVIFEDRDVASASERELRRQRSQRWAITAALGTVSLCVGIVPSLAWSRNQIQLLQLTSAVDGWEAPGRPTLDDHQKLEQLEPLRERVESLLGFERDGAPFMMHFGMYQGDRMVSPLRRYYAGLVRRELVQPLMQRDAQALSDFRQRYQSLPSQRPTIAEQDLYYRTLRLQLLLTQPHEASEPPFSGEPREWVETALRERWLPSAGDDKDLQGGVAKHAQLYCDFVTELPELAFPRDQEVVHGVRATLNRVPTIERALAHLIATAAHRNFDLSIFDLVGAVNVFRDVGKVRGAFTRRGYEQYVRDALTTELLEDAGELWVLGLAEGADPKAQRERQLAQLKTAYFKAYVDEWVNFLRRVRLTTPSPPTVPTVMQLFRDLTAQPAPVPTLVSQVAYNTQLPLKPSVQDAAETAATGVVEKLGKWVDQSTGTKTASGGAASAIKRMRESDSLTEAYVAAGLQDFVAFAAQKPVEGGAPPPTRRLPSDAYQEQLERVRDALALYTEDTSQQDQLAPRLSEARIRVADIVNSQPPMFRGIYEVLLPPPIAAATAATTTSVASNQGEGFCTAVYAEYVHGLAGRYPFNRDGQDAALADFSNFYRPKAGRVWTFVDSALSKTIIFDGEKYGPAPRLGEASNIYSPALFDFLNRSRELQLSYFPTGATEPSVEFEVKVHPSPSVATTQFNVGGTAVEHYNGPEKWKTLSWPGPDPAAGAALVIRGANGMQERIKQDGPWGLFRLLEAGTLRPEAGRTFSIAWQLQTHDVTLVVDFRPKRGESPFLGVPGHTPSQKLLAPVRVAGVYPPKAMVSGGRPCK